MTDRTGASYDLVADKYAETIGDELDTRPLERGLLDAFVALLGPGAAVLDIGCGPGHVTGYLAARGIAASGVDLSPRMIEIAGSRYPGSGFSVGTMLDLAADDGALDGALAWFSVIHVPDEDRPLAYAEMARVVRPDGWLLLGFHVSGQSPVGPRGPGEVARITTWWEHEVDLSFHYLEPSLEVESLAASGWRTVARLEREPMTATEPQTRRCYLLLQRT